MSRANGILFASVSVAALVSVWLLRRRLDSIVTVIVDGPRRTVELRSQSARQAQPNGGMGIEYHSSQSIREMLNGAECDYNDVHRSARRPDREPWFRVDDANPEDVDESATCATEDCDDTLDDGEGWNGYCGNCADRIYAAECDDVYDTEDGV
jgi:hypothetical protein